VDRARRMSLDFYIAARMLHVLGVVIWIGGVAFVTTIVLPSLKALEPDRRVVLFEAIERRFTWIARAMVLLVGASGFYMVAAFDLWERFGQLSYWWMDAMVAVFVIFASILFVLEPLILHRRFVLQMKENPEAAVARMQILHWVLLVLSLLTVAGAVAGVHGYSFLG
jgi:uncharacterized membrane protein